MSSDFSFTLASRLIFNTQCPCPKCSTGPTTITQGHILHFYRQGFLYLVFSSRNLFGSRHFDFSFKPFSLEQNFDLLFWSLKLWTIANDSLVIIKANFSWKQKLFCSGTKLLNLTKKGLQCQEIQNIWISFFQQYQLFRNKTCNCYQLPTFRTVVIN